MGAPKENQFWKTRAKHGRDKIFSEPEILWESACDYFQWCDENPWHQQNWVGKDGEEVTRNLKRPYTLSGLSVYLDCDEQTLKNYGTKEEYKDFFGVYTRIVQIIRTQKFEGAAVGIFNASIIARDLGLKDNQDVTTKGEAINQYNVTLKL